MDPNTVPPHLLPTDAHGAGDYPLQVLGAIFDDQKTRRDAIMTAHNLSPQMLAQSVFPNLHTIVRYDESIIEEMLEDNHQKTSKPTSAIPPPPTKSTTTAKVRNHSSSPLEVKCFSFLVQDFMKMYEEATGKVLFKPPKSKAHVDPRYVGSLLNMPTTTYQQGRKVVFYCKECYHRNIENPLAVCQFIYDNNCDIPSSAAEDSCSHSSPSPPCSKRQKTQSSSTNPPPPPCPNPFPNSLQFLINLHPWMVRPL
jgi:hypothetical protein